MVSFIFHFNRRILLFFFAISFIPCATICEMKFNFLCRSSMALRVETQCERNKKLWQKCAVITAVTVYGISFNPSPSLSGNVPILIGCFKIIDCYDVINDIITHLTRTPRPQCERKEEKTKLLNQKIE